MEFLFKETAERDLQFFAKNQKIIKRIEALLKDIQQHPLFGIGKPEALKENLSGFWSRRINREHRIIYTYEEDAVTFYSFRGHC
ncbi:MAG: Txe/YoeB family addiction module toxin [Bacteroidales bacterium]|jgi:toxin YoeB|nr:Txe/YoeB family addiction module toxin [Bacteroidales bacterium]